ncbi:TPA: metallophosphoesterase [Photobacterium damselae]
MKITPHDHDFSIYNGEQVRNVLLESSVETYDDSIINLIKKGQSEYFNFESSICNVDLIKETSLAKMYFIENGDFKYSIQSLNTAWCSTINEVGGSLVFPVDKIIENKDQDHLKIVFFHHPLSWFEPNNSKQIRNTLRDSNNIIITGHEHVNDSFKVETDSSLSLMIEASTFYDKSIDDNGFIIFEPDETDVLISKYTWDGNNFIETATKKKSDVIKLASVSSQGFSLNFNYFNYLNDIGSGFSHPDVDNLNIDDIYVYPNVRDLNPDNTTLKRETSEGLLDNNNVCNLILVGEECCGKTTLLKKLYLDSINKGKIPILIDGTSIRKPRKYDYKKLNEVIKYQYVNLDVTKLTEEMKEKVLIIDNFDYIYGDDKSKKAFLDSISHFFDKVVISVSDSYDLSESQIKGNLIFENDFIKMEILKLGYRLRYELINKWNKLKVHCEESNRELLLSNDLSATTINRIIGKNYIPSTPFFLLTMLQSMDSGHATDMNTSSYGYYYQYLITSSLGSSSVKKENLDEIFNYIKELSFYFYENKLKEDKYDDLWDFNAKFCSSYGLKVDCQPRLDLLVKAKILKSDNNYYSFKYPYVYYFFIAKYLSENLDDNNTDIIIDNLIKTLDKRRSMSILMFLTHHSKDKSILDRIVINSKNLFSNLEPTDLGINAQFIDKIIDGLPSLNYEEKDCHEYRLSIEDDKDNQEALLESESESEFESKFESESEQSNSLANMINEFNLTFKSLDLLGQLTRNYYGSLKVEQKECLLTEAIHAPLRALESILGTLRDDPEQVLLMIEDKLRERMNAKDLSSQVDINNIARQLLYNVIYAVTYNIIKKVSTSIGSHNLIPVIESISKNENTNSLKLIELSTRLDIGNHGSISEIRKLMKDFKSSGLSTMILKSMVLNYLYMFELPESERKMLCSSVQINYNPVAKQIGYEKLLNNN